MSASPTTATPSEARAAPSAAAAAAAAAATADVDAAAAAAVRPTHRNATHRPGNDDASSDYADVWYRSSCGELTLFARRYPADDDAWRRRRRTLLCMHGLSRNSSDFEDVCTSLLREHDDVRIVSVDQRGRGRSEYDPRPERYVIPVYAADMFALLDHLALATNTADATDAADDANARVTLVGTSMGGIIGMVMAMAAPHRFAAVLLNDIGPRLDDAGLERIKGYAGKLAPPRTFAECAEQQRFVNGVAFPSAPARTWQRFARRAYVGDDDAGWQPAFDVAIAKALAATSADKPTSQSAASDAAVAVAAAEKKDDDTTAATAAAATTGLWAFFDVAAKHSLPVLAVRGALSDLLSAATLEEMRTRHPAKLRTVTVPDVGHAPMLDEAQALDAVHAFIRQTQPSNIATFTP